MTTAFIPTPASCRPCLSAVVLGAGIAGLTAAHELAERGFEVTVYEPAADERAQLEPGSAVRYPPVKLGGLAASQYSTATRGPDGASARLRPFPGRLAPTDPPPRPVAGEHGFRFFPAYYLHIWDLLQRIPIYEPVGDDAVGPPRWQPTSRTVMDNVRRVVTQATTVAHGHPSLIFPREAPRSLSELLTVIGQLSQFGYTPEDVQTFSGRLLEYLSTSPLRRAAELENISAYDYFVGRQPDGSTRFPYSQRFEALILDMPKVLAAFDSRWGDARTNLNTYLQLQLQMDRRDNKADGVLNGPTTEAWFDHWYRHLVALGVTFRQGRVERIDPPPIDPAVPPHLRPRVRVVLADGTVLAPDYVVVATDAPEAERVTWAVRAVGTGGTVAGLEGFTTSLSPPRAPFVPPATQPPMTRDPYAMAEMGKEPWDRFQTLAGIQFFFDTEFQLVRGHVYYSGSPWGLSSINQHGLWERRPILGRDGHVSVLSVDIGDFNTPSPAVLDAAGRPKAARDCTPDELAAEVWRQIVSALTSEVDDAPSGVMPWPIWYTLDRNLELATLAGGGEGPPVRNGAPYLVPIVGDWCNRPGGDPWNPHGTSWTVRPTEDRWLEDLEHRFVWQARHGGYQVHHNSLVFAGTWTKTFTRMTSMEAACESARHAVNAILDHYVWVETGGADRREHTTLDWRFPFGFLDQGYSSPIRLPTPAGDYCFVFDIENREPLDVRSVRNLDSAYWRSGLPPPWVAPAAPVDAVPHPIAVGTPAAGSTANDTPAAAADGPPVPIGGPAMTTTPYDPVAQLLAYLQAWRQYLEQLLGGSPPPAPWLPPSSWPGLPGYPLPTPQGWPAPPGWSGTPAGTGTDGPATGNAASASSPGGSPGGDGPHDGGAGRPGSGRGYGVGRGTDLVQPASSVGSVERRPPAWFGGGFHDADVSARWERPDVDLPPRPGDRPVGSAFPWAAEQARVMQSAPAHTTTRSLYASGRALERRRTAGLADAASPEAPSTPARTPTLGRGAPGLGTLQTVPPTNPDGSALVRDRRGLVQSAAPGASIAGRWDARPAGAPRVVPGPVPPAGPPRGGGPVLPGWSTLPGLASPSGPAGPVPAPGASYGAPSEIVGGDATAR